MLDGRRHFLSDLTKELHCSAQTVGRLARTIGAVIGDSLEEGFEKRRRWYRIRAASYLSLGQNYEELRYLSVCRELTASISAKDVLTRVDGTIVQLALLMAELNHAGEAKGRFAFFSKGRIDYGPHLASLETLLKAAEERRVCRVRYRTPGRARGKERLFAPRQIVAMNSALYVLGADVDTHAAPLRLTNLAVHRIESAGMTDTRHKLTIPAAEAGSFGLPWHEPRTFSIRFTPGYASNYVRERMWADEQKMEDAEDGGLILAITTRSERELASWVRSFGDEARFVPETAQGVPSRPVSLMI
jgi:predicted DNA-binding transcriptional regulator YafY